MVTLEQIDQVVERTGVTYEQAREALEAVGGDVLEAIIYLETTKTGFTDNVGSNINEKKEALLGTLKELIKKGNVTRVMIKTEDKVLIDLPIYVGAIGIYFAPILSLIGTTIAALNNYSIVIQTEEDKEYNLNEMTEAQLKKLKKTISRNKKDVAPSKFDEEDIVVDVEEVVEDIQETTEEVKEQVKEDIEDVVEEMKEETEMK